MSLPLASTRVFGPMADAIHVLSPNAVMVSPTTLTAWTQGRLESPVQMWPKTTRSAAVGEEVWEAR